jgi:ABC-type molybdate transport system substrate-binding protein
MFNRLFAPYQRQSQSAANRSNRSRITLTNCRLFIIYCSVFILFAVGCSEEKPTMYLFCNETFWYVMQEECIAFNAIYKQRIIIVPVRPPIGEKEAATVTIENDSSEAAHVPEKWQSIPRRDDADNTGNSGKNTGQTTALNPDINKQLDDLSKNYFGDIFVTDSENQINKLRELTMVNKATPVCHLTLTLLTATDNPRKLTSVKSVIDGQYKLGCVNPGIDGLGEASLKVIMRTVSADAKNEDNAVLPDNVQLYDRQYELLEALETGNIDAALVWDATSINGFLIAKYANEYNTTYSAFFKEVQRSKNPEKILTALDMVQKELVEEKTFGTTVTIYENPNERYVTAVPVITLSTANSVGFCQRFNDFLVSTTGKSILKRFGFTP